MSRFKGRNVGTIWRKELLDIVRDRRTLMSMIVIPLLLMPALIFGIGSMMATSMNKLQERSYTIGLIDSRLSPKLMKVMKGTERIDFLDLNGDSTTARSMLEAGDIQGVVLFVPRAGEAGDINADVRLWVKKNKETSSLAIKRIEGVLKDYREELAKKRLASLGAPDDILTPFTIREENQASEEQMAAAGLASLLPYMLILMTLTGAIYPAIDMTAGEKERGTLETLLASPSGRLEIVLGKFFAVMTTSLVSALISMTSMMVVLSYGMVMLGSQVGEQLSFHINFWNILIAMAMMIPLAALFSSLLMTISVFAKSTREAQSYIVPLNILVIIPAMMSMLPGTEGDATRAWTPIVNVSLVLKDILNGNLDPAILAITLLSTTIYAGIGIFITMRVFQRENVLFRV